MSDTGAGGGGDDPDPRYARLTVGVRLLGDAIRRKRGEQGLSQKAAAREWAFPYSTLCALETHQVRNYQVANIARLDPILGVDAWDMLQQPDQSGVEELRAELAELREVVTELRAVCDAVGVTPPAGMLEALGLTDGETELVMAFAHLLVSRRRD